LNYSLARLERSLDKYNNAGGWKTSCLTKALALALLPKSWCTPKLLAKILCCSNFLSANKHFDVPLGWKNPFTEQHETLLSKKMLNIYLNRCVEFLKFLCILRAIGIEEPVCSTISYSFL
jgi:hypothetical protein